MKNILILLSFLITSLSWGQFTDSQKQNLNAKNILTNSGFESGRYGWTSTVVTPTIDTSAGFSRSIRFTASSQAWTLVQDSTQYATALADGIPGTLNFRLKTNHTGVITICPRLAGVTTTTCVTAVANNKWGNYTIPYVLGGTSNGVSFSAATGTGDTYIDDVEYETKFTSDQNVITTPWKAYTPVTQGFGTIASVDVDWRQVGSNVEIRGSFVTGTTTTVEARIGLPNNWVIGGVASGVIPAGRLLRAVSSNSYLHILGVKGNSYVNMGSFERTTASDQDALVTGDYTGTGERITFNFSIPVADLAAGVNTYSQPCTNDIDCTNAFSFTVAAGGAVTDDTLDLINGNCTNASPRVCTFNSGILSVAPSCTTDNDPIAAYTGTTSVSVSNNAATTKVTCFKSGIDLKVRKAIIGSFNQIKTTAILQDIKTDGTDGGTFTSGAWQTRALTNIAHDPRSIVTSLSANQFTLPAGEYIVIFRAIGFAVDQHQTRLRNITDSTTAGLGHRFNSSSGSSGVGDSMGTAYVSITSPKVFELQHRCGTTKATNGFGSGTSTFGENIIFATVEIRKID